jgi:hypothetical protein
MENLIPFVKFDETLWKCPGQQTHLERKLNEKGIIDQNLPAV